MSLEYKYTTSGTRTIEFKTPGQLIITAVGGGGGGGPGVQGAAGGYASVIEATYENFPKMTLQLNILIGGGGGSASNGSTNGGGGGGGGLTFVRHTLPANPLIWIMAGGGGGGSSGSIHMRGSNSDDNGGAAGGQNGGGGNGYNGKGGLVSGEDESVGGSDGGNFGFDGSNNNTDSAGSGSGGVDTGVILGGIGVGNGGSNGGGDGGSNGCGGGGGGYGGGASGSLYNGNPGGGGAGGSYDHLPDPESDMLTPEMLETRGLDVRPPLRGGLPTTTIITTPLDLFSRGVNPFKYGYGSAGDGNDGSGGYVRMIYTPYANVCFPSKTPITTDQGVFNIEKINLKNHTIDNKKIIAISQTISSEKHLVCIEPNSLGPNCPSKRTIMSLMHGVYIKNKLIRAKNLVNRKGIYRIPYNKEILYNVIMEQHNKMVVNNLICETMHPTTFISSLYMKLYKAKEDKAKADKAKADKAKADNAKADKAKVDKAKVDKAKVDKAKADKAKEDKAKEDKAKEDKAKADKAKADKAKEDKAKADKSNESNIKNKIPINK